MPPVPMYAYFVWILKYWTGPWILIYLTSLAWDLVTFIQDNLSKILKGLKQVYLFFTTPILAKNIMTLYFVIQTPA